MEYKDLPSVISDIKQKASTCGEVCARAECISHQCEPGYVSISSCDRNYIRVNAKDFAEFMSKQEIKFRNMLPPLEHAHETLNSVAVGLLYNK